MNYWLVKTEPEAYSWQVFVRDGIGMWDGVRNFQARNNLKAMKIDDLVLFYHSVSDKEVVGIAKVTREHFPDPTTDDKKWVAVEMVPVQQLDRPVTLAHIKQEERLSEIKLIRQSRLSVVPLKREEFDTIVEMGTKKH